MKRFKLWSCIIGLMFIMTAILTGCGAKSIDLGGGIGPGPGPSPDPTDPPIVMATVSGTIMDSLNNIPIAGATVSIAGITTTTDANGNYSLQVPAGETVIAVNAPGYDEIRQNITVPESGITLPNIGLSLAVTSPETLMGTITDPSGKPISGAVINISVPGGSQVATATTNEFGVYKAENIPADLYSVSITAFGYGQYVGEAETTLTGPTTLDVSLSPASSFKFYADNETLKQAGTGGHFAYTYVPYLGVTMQEWIQNATLERNQEWYDKWRDNADHNGEYGPVELPDPTKSYLIRLGGFAELTFAGAYINEGPTMWFKPDVYNTNPVTEIRNLIIANGLPLNKGAFMATVTTPGGFIMPGELWLSAPPVFVPIYPYSVNTKMANQPVLDGHYRVFYDIRGDHSIDLDTQVTSTMDGTIETEITATKYIPPALTKWNPYAIAGTTMANPYEAGTGMYYNLCLWFDKGPQTLAYDKQSNWAGRDIKIRKYDTTTSPKTLIEENDGDPTEGEWKTSMRTGTAIPNYFKVPVKSGQKLDVTIIYAYDHSRGVDLDLALYDDKGTMISSTRGVLHSTEKLSVVATKDTYYIIEVKNYLPTIARRNLTGIPYAMQITKTPEDANRSASDTELPASRMSGKVNL